MKTLYLLITELIDQKFYGELLLKFQHGKITQCKKSESIKLEE